MTTPDPTPLAPTHLYHALVTGVHDGDTFTADVEVGLDIWVHGQRFRLAGLDAPELPTPEGEASLGALRQCLDHSASQVVLQAYRPATDLDKEKYGRWLAVVWARRNRGQGEQYNVNEWLVAQGWATGNRDVVGEAV